MYEYIPNPPKKKAKTVGMTLFILSLVIFFVSGIKGIAYPAILQTAAIVLMTAAILLVGKYLTRAYRYRVERTSGEYELIVDEISKTSSVTVCRLELQKLCKVEAWTKGYKPPKRAKIYDYCVDVAPTDSYLLTFLDAAFSMNGEKIYVRISPDERLIEILEGFLKQNGGTPNEL